MKLGNVQIGESVYMCVGGEGILNIMWMPWKAAVKV